MCGWVGIFGEPVSRAHLEAANDLLASRGPDDDGIRQLTGSLVGGLAHRRLAILDPSPAGAQPMHDADRRITVVYNGEIYNSPALRAELSAKGVRFRSTTDTEVLLEGWAQWGDSVLDRIEGMFSFALVDETEGRVLLARDRLGVKPLYWAHDQGVLVAGSAPRALLALRPGLGARTDRVALAQFLTLLWIPHPRTPWSAIQKLPPATALSFDNGTMRQWRYWDPPQPATSDVAPDELRHRVADATRRQLLSDVPIGVLFSGGLDSTLILQLLRERDACDPIRALSAGYSPADQRHEIVPDDLAFAREFGSADDVDLTEVIIGHDAIDDVDRLGMHFDDPVADPAALTLHRLCRASDRKVLLSGVGGEELLAGYPRHLALSHGRRLAGLPWPARRLAARAAPLLRGGRAGIAHGLRRNGQKLLRSTSRRTPHYWQMMGHLTLSELQALMPDAALDAFDELDSLSTPLDRTDLHEALSFDRSQFLPNLNLAYVDRASMASGVEVRVPLLDEVVVGLVGASDGAGFVGHGRGKLPLRACARGLVPDVVIDRPKTGFGAPTRSWFQAPGAAALLDRMDFAADSGLVARPGVRHIYADASSGRTDAALPAWALVCLAVWQRCHGFRGGGG
jgi:asparagine synthase (glutamine-hydrolysing)